MCIRDRCSLYGVGPKVADCIALFALHRLDRFPVDTHISAVLSQYYPLGFPEERYAGFQGVMPVSYTHLDVYKRQAPWDGWFRITSIGAGGAGATGGAFYAVRRKVAGSGGGGGGSGGCSVSVLYCKAGDTLSITYNGSAKAAGTVGGEAITVYASAGGTGKPGDVGSYTTIPSGGNGGAAGDVYKRQLLIVAIKGLVDN